MTVPTSIENGVGVAIRCNSFRNAVWLSNAASTAQTQRGYPGRYMRERERGRGEGERGGGGTDRDEMTRGGGRGEKETS